MRQETYINETLIQYLLGSLPAEEVELFDELSIADDEFVNSLNGAEDDLVDSYVRGELTGSEFAAFRSSYLTSADKHERVFFAQSLQNFCEGSAADKFATSTVALTAAVADKQSSLANLFNLPRLMKWGIAAAMVVLIAFAWLAFRNLRVLRQDTDGRVGTEASKNTEQKNEVADTSEQLAPEQEKREKSNQEVGSEKRELTKTEQTPKDRKSFSRGEANIASLVLTPQIRGIGQLYALSLPPNANIVAVQLQLEPNDYTIYRVALLTESSHVLWRSNKIKTNETVSAKTLKINFPAKLLTPEVFVLQVYGVDANKAEALSAYPFRVIE